MSSSAHNGIATTASVESESACRLLVIYEDDAAHERAMEAAQHLSLQFKDEVTFAVASCAFPDLARHDSAAGAFEAAALADVLVVATHGRLSAEAGDWLESSLARRKGREGALVLLLVEPVDPTAPILSLLARWNRAAANLKMDFLPLLPRSAEELLARMPSPSATLPQSRGHEKPPSHWGLNE